MKRCALIKAGRLEYNAGLSLQEKAGDLVREKICDGVLLLLEHPAVITIGRSGGQEGITEDAAVLNANGVKIAHAARGGKVTCHNPGQIVGYPVLDLTKWHRDVHWYVDRLEEVIIRTLAAVGLRAGRKAKYTGVWLDNDKIAAIGIAVNHWVTYHGFALNVANDLALFGKIIPCGIREFGVTSLQKAGVAVDRSEVAAILLDKFAEVFQCTFVAATLENAAVAVSVN
jgi:lipoate-protein ligase B